MYVGGAGGGGGGHTKYLYHLINIAERERERNEINCIIIIKAHNFVLISRDCRAMTKYFLIYF